jgi:ribonucleoside-diphosphate reductase alpha chain
MIEPSLTEISQSILAKRYLIRNAQKEVVETPKGLFQRVARAIASVEQGPAEREKWESIYYTMMASCDFEPNTPCLVNAGRPDGTGQLSACFVIPVHDSMDGIFTALHHAAMIFKSGGGVGYSFSRLRPEGDFVASTSGIASGPCSFMEVFDFATERIKQGGVRRGANMGILRIDHPDILRFIRLKQDSAKMQNFNVSVAITDAFMLALEAGKDYDLVHPTSGNVVGQLNAPTVWREIVHCAHVIGDPGLFFIDRVNAADPLSAALGPIEATNPCGEVPLRPFDACCLGSINLAKFYVEKQNGNARHSNVTLRHGSIDFDRLQKTVTNSVRFLDNMLSINRYPIPEIADVTSKCRKIGLGAMGWADLLIQLGIPYGSPEARELGGHVQKLVNGWAVDASEGLAEERGPFHYWDVSTWKKNGDKPRRHSTVSVIAPTGTISMIAGCSSGIEPLYALSMTREQAGLSLQEVSPLVEKIAKREGFWSDQLAESVRQTGSLKTAPGVPDHWRAVFATANELDMEAHVGMQAAFQAHVEDGVSKCLAAGTLLPTSRGLMRIEDFSTVESDDTFVALDGSITTGGHRIVQHYRAGLKPSTRVVFDSGAQLVGATASHRVMTIDGWKLMSELRPGDKVIGRFEESHSAGSEPLDGDDTWRTNAKQIPFPKYMSPSLAEWLGMLCADGHIIESTGNVGLTCANDIVEQRFIDLSQLLFDITPRVTRDDRTENVRYVSITSRNLVRRVHSLIGSGAYGKHAPDAILRGSSIEKRAFLRGITLDGFITDDHGLCVYGGMSETLAYHVAEICRSFGLPKVYQGSKTVVGASLPGARCYNVYVSGLMQAQIDCVEPHKNRAPADVSWSVHVDREMVERTTVPVDHPNYGALRSLKQDTSRRYCTSRVAEVFSWPTDRIVLTARSVEDAGLVELYDVEVEHSHEYVVNGVVSHNTVNLRNAATETDVEQAYLAAWQKGCKGITVYRDGCRSGQVLTAGVAVKPAEVNTPSAVPVGTPLFPAVKRRVPASGIRGGVTLTKSTPYGSVHMTLNNHPDDGKPFELFVRVGKSGSEVMAWAEAFGRVVSYTLSIPSPFSPQARLEEIARQLENIGGGDVWVAGQERVVSAPDAIAKMLLHYLQHGVQPVVVLPPSAPSIPVVVSTPVAALAAGSDVVPVQATGRAKSRSLSDLCPACGKATFTYQQRCGLCTNCGHSKC